MARRSLFIFCMLIGLSIVIAKYDFTFRNIRHKRSSRHNENMRHLRNLVGNIVDTETNTVYSINGHMQHSTAWHEGATTQTPLAPNSPPTSEQIACLSACQQCVEESPIGDRMKKAEDNCGPMCDCADSCFRMPIEEVGKLYGQHSNAGYGKECWWRIYTDILGNDVISLS